jgi:hypothetical protein
VKTPSDASPEPASDARARLTTAFGWVAGVCLGVLLNGLVFRLVGDGYPQIPTTFVAVVAGAFGGMAIADRAGPRGFAPLGIAAGVLLAIVLALVAALLLAPAASEPV